MWDDFSLSNYSFIWTQPHINQLADIRVNYAVTKIDYDVTCAGGVRGDFWRCFENKRTYVRMPRMHYDEQYVATIVGVPPLRSHTLHPCFKRDLLVETFFSGSTLLIRPKLDRLSKNIAPI